MAKTLRSANAVFKDMIAWAERSVNITVDGINTIAKDGTPNVNTGIAQNSWRRSANWKYRGRKKLDVIHNTAHYIAILDGAVPMRNRATSKYAPITQPAIDQMMAQSHYLNNR